MTGHHIILEDMTPAAASSNEEAEDDTRDVNKTYAYEIYPYLGTELRFDPYNISIPYKRTLLDLDENNTAGLRGNRETWIHIPTNDKAVAKNCIKMLGGDDEAEQFSRKWDQQLRPTGAVPRSILPNHAWIIEPSVDLDVIENGNLPHGTIFLSYLNWEVYGAVKSSSGNPDTKWSPTRHQRKTLDQFYYSGLKDTGRRDKGQTVSKWTGESGNMTENGRSEAVADSLVVMVDQMWMWTSESGTLVTCSPIHDSRLQEKAGTPSSADIMASFANKSKAVSNIEMLIFIVQHAVTGVFGGVEAGQGDILSIYRWAIANKAARQTKLLEDFRGRRQRQETEGMSNEGNEELEIALEVADIVDELYMIHRVLEQQEGVAQGIRQMVYKWDLYRNDFRSSPALSHISHVLLQLEAQKVDLKAVITDAERAHKMVLELLDLEQKAASLGEARITTKQGQAVMLFTVITVIFLPLSFFVSYFGQNVSELTGDPQNPTSGQVWKIAAPISVVVIVGSLAVAFFIMYSDSIKSCLRRKKTDQGEEESEV